MAKSIKETNIKISKQEMIEKLQEAGLPVDISSIGDEEIITDYEINFEDPDDPKVVITHFLPK